MLSNEDVRDRLNRFIEITGATQQFIAKNVNLSKASINLFLKNKRNLHNIYLVDIDNLIDSITEKLNNI